MSPVEEAILQDNTQRGARAFLWFKIVIVLCIVVGVLAFGILKVVGADFMSNESAPVAMGAVILMLAMGFASFLLCISFCVQWVCWMSWLYHAEKNLRTETSTKFSPWGAVICTALPYVGHLIDYFIIKDLIKHTDKVLGTVPDENENPKSKVNYLNGYLVMAILAGVVSVVKDSPFVTGSSFIFGIVAMVLFLKVFSEILSKEKALFKQYEEKVLRQKVDQVLREREIEKAASQIQEATYEGSNAQAKENLKK